jgi:hypothetical protein
VPTVAETSAAPTEFGAGLQAGTNTISQRQHVIFTQYVRVVLPLDGYVFWVNSALLRQSFLYNLMGYNESTLGSRDTTQTPLTLNALGSLHYASDIAQAETESATVNAVIFTAEQEIKDLNAVSPQMMYVGEFEGRRFAFSRRAAFYKQADLWHYRGDAIYATMETQLIDNLDDLAQNELIVSNSLPIWLALSAYVPPYNGMPGALPDCPIFPSFAVPENYPPPYVTAHISPQSTLPLQAVPRLDQFLDSYQLAADTVVLTMRGLRNNAAIDFLNWLMQYSVDTDRFGLMDLPIIRDEKETQKEFGILAQKKVLTLQVSYYQTRIQQLSRQLIEQAFITLIPEPYPT